MMPPPLARWAAGADIASCRPGSRVAIRQFLGRVHAIEPAARRRSGPGSPSRPGRTSRPRRRPGTPPEAFLAAVIAARRDRDHARLRREAELRRRLTRAAMSAAARRPRRSAHPTTCSRHLRRARDHADRHYADDRGPRVARGGRRDQQVALPPAVPGDVRPLPAAYVSQRRVERAQDLLRATNLTVTEVCHAVGFSSLGSFSTRFRELVGETPTQFQRRYAEGAPKIPGCYVFMWGLAETQAAQGSASEEKHDTDPAS